MLVVGASGCVFGMMGMYMADVVLNFETIFLPWLRLAGVMSSFIFMVVIQVRGWVPATQGGSLIVRVGMGFFPEIHSFIHFW